MKKGRQPLLYVLSSVASWALDTGMFFVLHLLFGGVLGSAAEAVCNVAARVVSSFFNFNLNNRLVFQNRGSYGKALLRYYCLAVPQLAASTLLLTLVVFLLKLESTEATTAAKITVDGLLFIASYFIQKFWVFRDKDHPAGTESAEDPEYNIDGQTERNEKHDL